ncbi:DUF934 domain-containing protein [Hyphomonas pacifica]|uniref:Oxidoreductase n=1 Tax=Hyphomonas pacifica TaxID=1280941 RepID=A0A062TWC3_9PROT|nr:DUF934 domain-containing protein [Hyphomonas pacifica]KCZ52341.1 hypothetical protein HY2_09015 [Hyphomonas pacifica]RAN34765.1 hypothetical protein HY3_09710 [Hyphomonas pacifica]RAN36368.1 hypothetical protein HY11_01210 [Hyphomonas pacifica]
MPLIKHGAEIDDIWAYVPDEADLSPGGCITVSLARFRSERDILLARNTDIGVRLAPEDDPHELEDFLDRLQLIEISFPKYTDGRGYSQAQLLRRRFNYAGELRAVGHVLRDQIFYMNRSGFDAYETARADLHQVLEALNEYTEVYQPGAAGQVPVFRKRHKG